MSRLAFAIWGALVFGALLAVGCGDDETASGGNGATGGSGGSGGESCNPADCPDDEGECRVPACLGESCGYMDLAEGAACSLGVCNAVGQCVECVGPNDCGVDELCMGNACVPTMCTNGRVDTGESDVDCGGNICPPCANGMMCNGALDCASNHCDAASTCAACQPGECAAGEYCNAGNCVAQKPDGQGCSAVAECTSGFCQDAVCCNMACAGTCAACDVVAGTCTPHADGTDPESECGSDSCNGAGKCSCADLVLSAGETDVDCGGATCAPCADGKACTVNGDCVNGACIANVCFGGCSNNMLDPGETAVDCGGPTCGPCSDGLACNVAGDCQSGVCNVVCQVPTCSDGVQNGNEPGVDCGVSCPQPCPDNSGCNVAGDCQSGVCALNTCQPPTCMDTVTNGAETDVDCGGGTCGACSFGETCALNQDCVSNICNATTCACSPDLLPQNDGSGAMGGVGLPSLVISEIDPGGYIELFNSTNNPIALGASTQWLCSPFSYAELSALAPAVTVPAHGYAVIPWPVGFSGPNDAGGEVILYASASFVTNTDILDFVCWGTYADTRKPQAEAIGKWSGACDTALTNGAIHRAINTTGTSAAHYSTSAPKSPMTCAP
jgi:hypothetical protein